MKSKNQDEMDAGLSVWLGDSAVSPAPAQDKLLEDLDRLFAGEPETAVIKDALAHLKETLSERTESAVYYDAISNTPVGTVYVAVGNKGLTALNFGVEEVEFQRSLERRGHKRVIRSAEETAEARLQVRQYLEGRRNRFSIPVDLTDLTEFQKQVLMEAARIPRGQVATYSAIARSLGRPKSSRAVGRALGSNPVPLVIPCHRVVGADGSLRGYSAGGGIKSKAFLLKLEGVQVEGTYQVGP